MKLIFCPHCHEVFSLTRTTKYCRCRMSSGKYTDSLYADVYGDGVPLGIDNKAFTRALVQRPERGMGSEFTAFVIPKEVHTIRYKKDEKEEDEALLNKDIVDIFWENERKKKRKRRRH